MIAICPRSTTSTPCSGSIALSHIADKASLRLEGVEYGVRRYTDEMNRLYGVLERRLEGREYISSEYSIADVACFPWIVHHEWQGQSLDDFPNLARWFAAVRDRPATRRAYAKGHVRMADAEAYRFLYGQTSQSVDQQRKEHER